VAEDAVLVGDHARVAGRPSELLDIAAEDQGAAARQHVHRRQHQGHRRGDVEHRLRQALVIGGGPCALGELEVVGDRPRLVLAQPVQQPRVIQAPDRRPRVEVAERLRVDAHDHDVLRLGRVLADREARVDRGQLGALEDVEMPERERHQRHHAADRQGGHGERQTAAGPHGA
jgi:hypothetical protein